MTDILVVPIAPSPNNTSGSITPRLLSASLGDAYRHELADGLNPFETSYTLTWELLPEADAEALVAFLKAHIGVPFFYRLPRDQAPRTWVWKSLQISHPLPLHDTVTITVEERFVY